MVQLALEPQLSSVPSARHWVRDVLDGFVRDGSCHPVVEGSVLELLTSEAVANAVLHGRGEVVVDVSCRAGTVRVAVSDDHAERPVVRRQGPEVVGGHGMALIDALSSRWGVDPTTDGGPGKTVWFELGS